MTTIPPLTPAPGARPNATCPTPGCDSPVRFAFDTTTAYVACRVSGHVNPTPNPDPETV